MLLPQNPAYTLTIKYIYIPTNEPATEQELFNGTRVGNKSHGTENFRKFRKYRGQKLSKDSEGYQFYDKAFKILGAYILRWGI